MKVRRLPVFENLVLLRVHCVKIVRIRSFSGPHFPAFSPNAGKYGPEKLRIQTLFTQCFSCENLTEMKSNSQNNIAILHNPSGKTA